jgi:hypothetical protein
MEMRAVHGICDGRMCCDESVELTGLTSGPYIFDRIERGARSLKERSAGPTVECHNLETCSQVLNHDDDDGVCFQKSLE